MQKVRTSQSVLLKQGDPRFNGWSDDWDIKLDDQNQGRVQCSNNGFDHWLVERACQKYGWSGGDDVADEERKT